MSIWTALSDYVSGILQPAQWFVDWIGGAGEPGTRRVGPERALTYAAVYRAVSLISGQTATLPLHASPAAASNGGATTPPSPTSPPIPLRRMLLVAVAESDGGEGGRVGCGEPPRPPYPPAASGPLPSADLRRRRRRRRRCR